MSHPPTSPGPDLAPLAGQRFLTLDQVAAELTVSRSQVYALVRDKALVALKIGGRGVWRVERSRLEAYIADLYRVAGSTSPAETPVDPAGELADQDGGPGEAGAS